MGALADRAEESLQKFFWLEEQGYMADLLIARPGQPAAEAVRGQRVALQLSLGHRLWISSRERRRAGLWPRPCVI